MQTLQPSLRRAMFVEISSSRNGCLSSSQNEICCPSRNLDPIWQVSTQVIGPGRRAASVGSAYQTSRSISAVRHPMRREMLASRANLVRRSRFAPAAKPPVSSSRAAPRRRVSTTRNTQAAAINKLHGQSRSARLARQTQAVFNQVGSLPANTANALPNHSLNRTFCGMRQLGFISFSPNCRIPQNAG